MLSHHLDWIVVTLLEQLRLLEQREHRAASAARMSVPTADSMVVIRRLQASLPGVELEVVHQPGRPKVLTLSFDVEPE